MNDARVSQLTETLFCRLWLPPLSLYKAIPLLAMPHQKLSS